MTDEYFMTTRIYLLVESQVTSGELSECDQLCVTDNGKLWMSLINCQHSFIQRQAMKICIFPHTWRLNKINIIYREKR